MRRRTIIVLVCVLGGLVGGCAADGPEGVPGMRPTPATGGDTTPTTSPGGAPIPYDLYTHCGIHELKADGRYFERAGGPLTDGSGNPPPGWGNPSQQGRLVVTGDVAVFTDNMGHREEFRVREGATGFLQLCD